MSEFGFLKKQKKTKKCKRKIILMTIFMIVFFVFVNFILQVQIIDLLRNTLDKETENLASGKSKITKLKKLKDGLIRDYNEEFKNINRSFVELRNLNNIKTDDFFKMVKIVSLFISSDLGLTSVMYNRRFMELKGVSTKRKSITSFSENIKKSGKGYSAAVKDERIDPKGLIFFSMEIKENE